MPVAILGSELAFDARRSISTFIVFFFASSVIATSAISHSIAGNSVRLEILLIDSLCLFTFNIFLCKVSIRAE